MYNEPSDRAHDVIIAQLSCLQNIFDSFFTVFKIWETNEPVGEGKRDQGLWAEQFEQQYHSTSQ